MTIFKKLAGVAIGALALVGASNAADAANIGTILKWNAVNIQGTIEKGDAMKFAHTFDQLNRNKTVTLVLNSPGGDFDEAVLIMKLMGYAQDNFGTTFNTFLGKTDECASACTYLWALGKKKFLTFGGQLYVHAVVNYNAQLGMTSTGFETADSESLTLKAARFYKATGAPDSVVSKALIANPAGNVIGYPEIGEWGGTFLSDVDGHQFAGCAPVGPDKPLSVTCHD